jgi:DNA-binding NtrC family response regulator
LAEAADGGTLFLDEIGELGLPLQSKLLRFLESGEIRRVGSNRNRQVSVRLVTATNRRLADLVQQGDFREDLYYRLRVFVIEAPPLRERLSDVPLLCEHFLTTLRAGRGPFRCADACLDAMQNYSWPGNVRELRNAVERMMILADDGLIDESCLSREMALPGRPADAGDDDELNLSTLERAAIERALNECGGRKTEAAKRLGISIRTLYNRLAAYAADPTSTARRGDA